MSVAVEVCNESGSGISTSSEILASGDGAHVSTLVCQWLLIMGGRRLLICYSLLLVLAFARFVADGPLNILNAWSRSLSLGLRRGIAFT